MSSERDDAQQRTRGGVATVLNEIVEQTNLGIELLHNQLPVDDQVMGACEMLGLDPLYVANEGIFISIVNKDATNTVLDILKQRPLGQYASVIGTVNDKCSRQVISSSPAGGRRVINYLTGEQLPRIC